MRSGPMGFGEWALILTGHFVIGTHSQMKLGESSNLSQNLSTIEYVPHLNALKCKNYTLKDLRINRQHLMNPGDR